MNYQFMLKSQYWGAVLFILVLLLAGCQSEPQAVDEPPEAEAIVEATAVPPTDIPPTPIPEPTTTPEPALITDTADMAGIWLATVAGERGYFMFTEDGRYTLALSQDQVGTAPRVSGEYWFEDGEFHIRDLENAGHWLVCEAETVGVYEAVVQEDGKIKFQTVDDGCNEGGFTRNYIFANMTQERIGDPVHIVETEADAAP